MRFKKQLKLYLIFSLIVILLFININWGLFAFIGLLSGISVRYFSLGFMSSKMFRRYVLLFLLIIIGICIGTLMEFSNTMLLNFLFQQKNVYNFYWNFLNNTLHIFGIVYILILILLFPLTIYYLFRSIKYSQFHSLLITSIISIIIIPIVIILNIWYGWLGLYAPVEQPNFISVDYLGEIKYIRDRNIWEIRDEIQVSGTEKVKIYEQLVKGNGDYIDESLIEPSEDSIVVVTPTPNGGIVEVIPPKYTKPDTLVDQKITEFIARDNWKYIGKIDDKLRFVQMRTEPAFYRWIPATKINIIPMLSIEIDYYSSIKANKHSKIKVHAPENMISNTYPPSQGIDLLKKDLEEFDIYIGDQPELRIQVLSPIFRNRLGKEIIQASIWSPLKWIILAFCAIFAEQIRKSILIPVAKKIFKQLRIPFLEEETTTNK